MRTFDYKILVILAFFGVVIAVDSVCTYARISKKEWSVFECGRCIIGTFGGCLLTMVSISCLI